MCTTRPRRLSSFRIAAYSHVVEPQPLAKFADEVSRHPVHLQTNRTAGYENSHAAVVRPLPAVSELVKHKSQRDVNPPFVGSVGFNYTRDKISINPGSAMRIRDLLSFALIIRFFHYVSHDVFMRRHNLGNRKHEAITVLSFRSFRRLSRYRRRLSVLYRQHLRHRCRHGDNRRRRLVLRLHPGHQGFRHRGGFRRTRY